eukprot:scaffold135314_cov28-Attheya_sp.AAC.1
MGGRAVKKRESNVEKALQWLNAAKPEARDYIFKSVTALRSECAKKTGRTAKSFQQAEKNELIEVLISDQPNEDASSGDTPSTAPQTLHEKLLVQILKATFMTKLSDKGKEYAK